MNIFDKKQRLILDLVVGCKIAEQDGGVWCTSDKELQAIADEWIKLGYLVETTSKHFAPDDQDRSFELTVLGREETVSITVM